MASESVIVELLRQAQEERNRPSATMQGIASLQQVMEGVLKGIQLYDAAKGMGLKYGTGDKTVTETVAGTGSPAIPAQPPREALPPLSSSEAPLSRQIHALGDEFFKSLLKPGMQTATSRMGLSGLQGGGIPGSPSIPSFPIPSTRTLDPGTPAVPAVPPQTITKTIPGFPGTAKLDAIEKAYSITPDLGKQVASQLGTAVPGKSVAEKKLDMLEPVLDPTTGKVLYYRPANSVFQPQTDVTILPVDSKTGRPAGKEIKLPKGGRVLEVGNSSDKSRPEKLGAIAGSIEDDAKSQAQATLGFEADFPKKFQPVFQMEYIKMLRSRAAEFTLKEQNDFLRKRFPRTELVRTLDFIESNAEQISKAKQDVITKKAQPGWELQEPAYRSEMTKLGYPEEVIMEILSAQ